MIDTHCHLNLYPDPVGMAAYCDRQNIAAIWVTNSPASFEAWKQYLSGFQRVRIALGLHPLETARNRSQWDRFTDLISQTSYVGEVGLDFSRLGFRTKTQQVETFQFVLRSLQGHAKFMTIHSRGAESATLDLVEKYRQIPAVFHWYSGNLPSLKRAISNGHYFSINPAMISGRKGMSIISAIPRDRILTETDGPFVKIDGRPVMPGDVRRVLVELGSLWGLPVEEVDRTIWENFRNLLVQCGLNSTDATAQ